VLFLVRVAGRASGGESARVLETWRGAGGRDGGEVLDEYGDAGRVQGPGTTIERDVVTFGLGAKARAGEKTAVAGRRRCRVLGKRAGVSSTRAETGTLRRCGSAFRRRCHAIRVPNWTGGVLIGEVSRGLMRVLSGQPVPLGNTPLAGSGQQRMDLQDAPVRREGECS